MCAHACVYVFVFMLGNENWITFWVIRATCNPGNMYVCTCVDVFVFMLGNENWITFWVIRATCNPGNMYVCTCVCVCVHVG